ncbi:hypothetical protein WCWAEYFT_CDS0168 [Vibrio phage VB_VaC_TDDLMA]
MVDKINITDVQEDETNVDWYADGERANALVLNRPVKQIAGVVNEIIDEVDVLSQNSGINVYRGSNGQYIQDTDVIPSDINHLAVQIGSEIIVCPYVHVSNGSQEATGVISNLNTTTRPYSLTIGGSNYILLNPKYWLLPESGVNAGAFWLDESDVNTSSLQTALNAFDKITLPEMNLKVDDSLILSKSVYQIIGGAKSRLYFDQADFPSNGSILKSLEDDRPGGGTLALSIQNVDFYAYDPTTSAPSTVLGDASAIFASGFSASNGKSEIVSCRFRGFNVAIRGSAWWATSIKKCFFRTFANTGIGIDFRPGQYTGDNGWSNAFAVNSVTIEDCWFNTLNNCIMTGDQNVQKLRMINNTFERIDNVVYTGFNSDSTTLSHNHFEYVNTPFKIGFTSSNASPVREFQFTNNNLGVISNTSFINNAENSRFQDNTVKNTSVSDFTFFNGQPSWYDNNIIEYHNGLAFSSNISTEDNSIFDVATKRETIEGALISGENTNGRYIKYPDGTMICTHTVSVTANVTETFGSLFRSAEFFTWNFPADFAVGEFPYMDVKPRTADPHFCISQNGNELGTFRVVSYQSDGALTLNISMMATGKWK